MLPALVLAAHALLPVPVCVGVAGATAAHGAAKQDSAMHHLFQALDIDGDGQIRSAEALKYFQHHWKGGGDDDGGVSGAGKAFIEAIDTADEGDTVSEAELQRALSTRLQVRAPSTRPRLPRPRRGGGRSCTPLPIHDGMPMAPSQGRAPAAVLRHAHEPSPLPRTHPEGARVVSCCTCANAA